MMTLTGRLCALCAVCALAELMLGDMRGSEGLRMIGGLLMLHLVILGAQELYVQLTQAENLMHIYRILIG